MIKQRVGLLLLTISLIWYCIAAAEKLSAFETAIQQGDSTDCNDIFSYRDIDTAGLAKYNYTRKIIELSRYTNDSCYLNNKSVRKFVNTYLSYYHSFLANDDSAKFYDELVYQPVIAPALSEQDDGKFRQTISIACKLDQAFFDSVCRSKRLVMLNEAHHLSINRDMARIFLARLKQLGFQYFAVEGLDPKSRFDNQVVSYQNGYYLQSRSYTALLLEAKKLGYHIISYEDTTNASSAQREKLQAENIYSQTFAKDSNAKVFVYCGYAHICKDSGQYLYTAWYLKNLCGFDPLTFRQTSYYNHFFTSANAKGFTAIKDTFGSAYPFVIQIASQHRKADFDIVIPNTGLSLFPGAKTFDLDAFFGKNRTSNYLIFDSREYSLLGTNAIPLVVTDHRHQAGSEYSLPKGEYVGLEVDADFSLRSKKAFSIR